MTSTPSTTRTAARIRVERDELDAVATRLVLAGIPPTETTWNRLEELAVELRAAIVEEELEAIEGSAEERDYDHMLSLTTRTADDPRTAAADLVYPLRVTILELHGDLRRLGPPSSETIVRGRLYAETISTLRRCERLARELAPFDPTGL